MSFISFPLLRYVIIAALRDKIVFTLFLMILLGSSTAIFLGSATVTEENAFSVVFMAGGLRFLGVIGVVLFTCFHIRRSFDNKEIEFLLSRPISRVSFLVSHVAAFVIIAIIIAFVISMSIAVFSQPNFFGLLLWGGSLAIEYIIIATFALFFSMVLSSASGSALACLGIYVLARMMGTLLGISSSPNDSYLFEFLGKVMEFISIIIPRLDLMAQTEWLVYGIDNLNSVEFMRNATDFSKNLVNMLGIVGFIVIQAAIFTALLLSATIVDFLKKKF